MDDMTQEEIEIVIKKFLSYDTNYINRMLLQNSKEMSEMMDVVDAVIHIIICRYDNEVIL